MNSTINDKSSLKRLSMAGLLVTLGIVFGDIGTSPLYVMKAIESVTPDYSPEYIIGAVSCVIWTLTLQTTIKYVLLALIEERAAFSHYSHCLEKNTERSYG